MNEFMLAGIEKGQIPLELPESEKNTSAMPQPHEIVFEMDEKLKSAVAKSYQGFGQEMSQQDLKVSPPFLLLLYSADPSISYNPSFRASHSVDLDLARSLARSSADSTRR
jgi:hypothetical protein